MKKIIPGTRKLKLPIPYISFNKPQTSISERKNANGWIFFSRSQIEYNKKHLMIKHTIERSYYQTGNWKNQNVSICKYNSAGNLIEGTNEFYDLASGTIRNTDKFKIEYDSLNRKVCYERNGTTF